MTFESFEWWRFILPAAWFALVLGVCWFAAPAYERPPK